MIIEGLFKTIPIMYSITIVGIILYKLRLQANIKDNIVLLIGFGFILIGSFISVAATHRNYKFIFFYQSIFTYLGSTIIIITLLHIINVLNQYAYKDRLTGAYNQRALYNSIELHINKAKSSSSIFTLAFIDIDDFKSINDNFGHVTADTMLKDICSIIKKNIRKKDLLFRYGGDEFILLFPCSNKEETRQLMKRLESQLDKESGGVLRFSYGTASYPEEGLNAKILLNTADAQMYCRKNCKH